MTALKNIWSPSDGELPEDKLLAYLEGKLPPDEQHAIEQWLAQDGMEADALEGLQQQNINDTKRVLHDLNHQLHKDLKGKKRQRRKLMDNRWAWIAVVIVLLLAIAAYIVIHMAVK